MSGETFDVDAIASLDAEHSLIGALLLDNAAFDRVSDVLKPEYFFSETNRRVYAEIERQIMACKGCDVVTVGIALSNDIEISDLHAMAQYVPSAANVVRYAHTVVERFKSRALLAVSANITELAQEHQRSIEERVDLAQAQLVKLVGDAPRDEWVDAADGMVQHLSLLEDRAAGKIKAIPTGLHDLDRLLSGGLRPGSLVIIGARPSMGKTALAMTIATHVAQDYSVGFLSMEMSHADLRDRLTALLGRVPLDTVLQPSLRGNELDWDKVVDGIEKAKLLNLNISDQGALTINQVRSKARNLKRTHGIDMLVVDYIGLMNGLDARQQRTYQLEEISRGLKSLAKELAIPVLCLAQLNRKVEERTDQSPNLSDLRDSGAIEQDADVVLFVHRPIQTRPDMGDEWKHYAKLIAAKNRQGRCGGLSLTYIGEQTRFASWAGEAPTRRTVHTGRGGDVGL